MAPLKANAWHYYVEIGQKIKGTPGVAAKIAVIFAPPGGWGQPLPHFDPAKFHRFDPHTPGVLRIYAALQYALMVPFVSHFLAIFNGLATAPAVTYALGIFATCLVLGRLLEHRPTERALDLMLEQLRITSLGVAFAALPTWFGFVAPDALRLFMLAFALASAAWLNRQLPPKRAD